MDNSLTAWQQIPARGGQELTNGKLPGRYLVSSCRRSELQRAAVWTRLGSVAIFVWLSRRLGDSSSSVASWTDFTNVLAMLFFVLFQGGQEGVSLSLISL